MKVIAPFEVTKVSALVPGDLVRVRHSAEMLGIVIFRSDGNPVIGVVGDNRRVPPYHIVFERDFTCYRYPSDWALELPADAAVSSSDLWNVPGVAHLGPKGTLMNFAPVDGRQSPMTVNLSSFEWEDINISESVAFPRWRVWSSANDFQRQGASPIFTFTASQPA